MNKICTMFIHSKICKVYKSQVCLQRHYTLYYFQTTCTKNYSFNRSRFLHSIFRTSAGDVNQILHKDDIAFLECLFLFHEVQGSTSCLKYM
ncbi:hypothetical protein HanIR_Chr06g0299461 [Helianthus annuus]|nr:hypothetical protein HanIR_Chr06g0299461 [Helianthus annuus]